MRYLPLCLLVLWSALHVCMGAYFNAPVLTFVCMASELIGAFTGITLGLHAVKIGNMKAWSQRAPTTQPPPKNSVASRRSRAGNAPPTEPASNPPVEGDPSPS